MLEQPLPKAPNVRLFRGYRTLYPLALQFSITEKNIYINVFIAIQYFKYFYLISSQSSGLVLFSDIPLDAVHN